MAQTVTYATVSNIQPTGLCAAFQTQGHFVAQAPEGWLVDDAAAFLTFVSAYSGSATELSWSKTQKQTALDTLFDANFDLAKFIRAGTLTTVTAAQFGTFLATITNNYRSLRAQIATASTVAAVNAINVSSGWPSNP